MNLTLKIVHKTKKTNKLCYTGNDPVFLPIRPTDFLAVFVAVAAQHYTLLHFVRIKYKY